jgi:hypothetical protein
MADEIKPSANIGRVLPLNPSRDTGEKRRRPPPRPAKKKESRDPPDDRSPHVDEYV